MSVDKEETLGKPGKVEGRLQDSEPCRNLCLGTGNLLFLCFMHELNKLVIQSVAKVGVELSCCDLDPSLSYRDSLCA